LLLSLTVTPSDDRPFRRYVELLKAKLLRHHQAILIGICVLSIAAFLAVWAVFASVPGREALQTMGDMSQATTLYDVHDRPVFTIFKEYRVEVPLERMSPHLRRAILAIEDQRFSEHGGIDVLRILGAAWTDIRRGRRAQGGSTITQQLARQAFLDREKTFVRKIKEVALALRIEHMYSKDEILELYLNKVYFGDGLHGAEAAARGYFGKSASDLSLSEAALLAGLVSSPSNNAPTVSLPRAIARRNVVLQAMLEQGIITRQAFDRARDDRVDLRDTLRRQEPIGQYFKEEVRQQLVKEFGWPRISEGGLRVYTTIDPEMQKAAEAAVAQTLQQIEQRRAARMKKPAAPSDEPLQSALVAIDPTSGEVRAMVGGRDFTDSRFNRAIQAHRQPGSAFKPFVYATALESGYSPATVIDHLDDPISTLQGAWIPEDEHSTASAMTMRTALRTSSNRAAVQMLQTVGIAKTVYYARQMGIGSVPSVPSLALGSGEVTLMSMTSAYSVFAANGLKRPAIMIRRVEDQQGKIIFEAKPQAQQVLSASTAFLMASMLSDVVNRGTAYKARTEGFTLPAAGKTGTTNDFVDAWFVGFTPRLVAGVWIGFDQPHTILPNGFAGDLAVPLWAQFMKTATKADKPEWFTPPTDVVSGTVCAEYFPDTTECVREGTEYFVRGKAPAQTYVMHDPLAEAPRVALAEPAHDGTPAVAAPAAAPPATAAAVSADTRGSQPDAVAATDESPKKKRGFWGRLFGKGKSDDEKRDK
jgi:1A family penicillin-binding protein